MAEIVVVVDEKLNTWLEEQARLSLRSKAKQVEHLLIRAMAERQGQTEKAKTLHGC